jgi:predicted Zn-dependent peptidase
MSVEVTRLPSGLTVVTDSMPHLKTATVGVWVGSGSRDEQPDEHGISHLLEHMAFKGTKRRTTQQIAEQIEAVGGDINAATSFETTAYYASVLQADVPLALDVLSDILSNPTFDPTELKREQNVIVQEIGATEDTPDDLVFDYLQSSAFPGQPMGRPILGTPDSVCSFKDLNLRAYLSRNYRAPDMVISATGAIQHEAVVAEVENHFGHFNGPAAPAPQSAKFGGGARLEARDLEQVHIALAVEACRNATTAVQPASVHDCAGRRDVVAFVPRGARKARPLLHNLRLPCALHRYRDVRHLCRHRCRRREGIDAGHCRRNGRRCRRHQRS